MMTRDTQSRPDPVTQMGIERIPGIQFAGILLLK
jgi:hypothetical protein